MAAPSLRAAGTRVDGTGLSLTPAYPAVQAGDVILLHAFYHNGTTTTTGTWSVPTGFSLIRRQDLLIGGAKKGELATFARRATGSESGTVTVTRTGNSGNTTVSTANMTVWQDVGGSTDLDGIEAIGGVSDETPPYTHTVTTLGTERTAVAFVFANDNVASTGTDAAWTNVIAPYTDVTGPDYAGHVASRVAATAGGYAGSWSQSAGIEGAVIGLALKPVVLEQHSGTAAVTGGGSVTVATLKRGLNTALITGGGALSSTGLKRPTVAVVVQGNGIVLATGLPTKRTSLAVSGGGFVNVQSGKFVTRTAVVAGGGSVAAAGGAIVGGPAVVSGGGGTAATGRKLGRSAPSIVGGGGPILLSS